MLEGQMRGLEVTYKTSDPVRYEWQLGETSVVVNDLIGENLHIHFTGLKTCIACGRVVKKLFQNGYCFPCVRTLAECDLCIVKPQDCHFRNGTCRDDNFGLSHCMIPHYVYIAWSSGYKVGLTRKGRQLKRWMDQGATEAVVIAETPTRRAAGELEVAIAQRMNDKTDWRKMLKEENEPDRGILDVREEAIAHLPDSFSHYIFSEPQQVTRIVYPRQPDTIVKLKSLNLDKQPDITGEVKGIKGQYILFEDGVFNVKKFSGFHVEVQV